MGKRPDDARGVVCRECECLLVVDGRGEKPVHGTASVVGPDYLTRVVDAERGGSNATRGINRRVFAVAVDEVVFCCNRTVATDFAIPGDLSLCVDACRVSIDGPGKIENGISAKAVKEPLVVATVILSVRLV